MIRQTTHPKRDGRGMRALAAWMLTAALAWTGAEAASPPIEAVEDALRRFVEDYRSDPMLREATFGIEVDGKMWHVTARPGADSDSEKVELVAGAPPEPTFYFTMDRATLGKLDRGEMNPGTAMAKAFSTDVTPMDVAEMAGFTAGESFLDDLLKVTFHFWIRGNPEVIPFGDAYTRFTHGADAVILYYQPGLRSGWLSLKPGQHANEDPRSQTNPFPSMFVVTGGKGVAKIGGREIVVEEGQSLFVPPGVAHEFWNPYEAPMQVVLLMFGEGA